MPLIAMKSTNLKKLLADVQLPALPQSAMHLFELSQDPDNGPQEFAIPIEADPGLTSQVLKFVNSSYFGFANEISSIQQAITLVGVKTIKNFALWSAVFNILPNPHCGPFDLQVLWRDSLRRGLFARRLGQALGLKDAEELFAAGLLQDMAIPLLAQQLPEDYAEMLVERADSPQRLSQLELDRFGWTHGEAGALIAQQWQFPAEFADLIDQHTALESLVASGDASVAELAVALSAALPSSADDAWTEYEVFAAVFQKIAKPQTPNMIEILEFIDSQFAEFAPVMNISTTTKTLADFHRERTAGF
jgi:HD-like signal output (HDOD) protein